MPTEQRAAGYFERILHLRRLDALAELPAPELALVAEYARDRFFPAGSVVFHEGEPVPYLQIMVSGEVQVARQGRDLGRAGPGAGLGTLSLLSGDPEGIGVVTVADTFTLELEVDAVHELFEDRFPILRHVLRDTSRRVVRGVLELGKLPLPVPVKVPLRVPQRSLDLVERIVLLRAAETFAQASVNSLAELARSLEEVRLERGVPLWREGDASGTQLLIVEGQVACRGRGRAGRPLAFDAGPGLPIGALEALAELPHWYDAVTQTPVLALRGRIDDLLDVFEDNHRMATNLLAALARDLIRLLEVAREERRSQGLPPVGLSPYPGSGAAWPVEPEAAAP